MEKLTQEQIMKVKGMGFLRGRFLPGRILPAGLAKPGNRKTDGLHPDKVTAFPCQRNAKVQPQWENEQAIYGKCQKIQIDARPSFPVYRYIVHGFFIFTLCFFCNYRV